ncbi:MAG: siderophore biosynthesis protein SbnG [Chloroflexi bacterium]|nr:siderophore biosynthesis protein SbnG [Chloroflexota bacterium]MCH8818092.1 siderophore biosynthesis protein SbnG [Chloroflexota bacterium]
MAELRPNRAKEKLANGETVTCLAGVDTPHLVDFVGQIGIDAVWLEAEHGPVDFEAIGDLSRAADLWGVTPLVRVGSVDYNTIYRTLDMGAMGITVPHVDTAQDARDVVQAAKYAPIGNRGMYGPRQAFGVTDYVKKANDQTMVVVLIEDILAVNNLDEILAVDHVDVYHVAPSDLAQSMGHIGEDDHPDVQRTIEESITRIIAAGKIAGTTVGAGNVGRFRDQGVKFFYTSLNGWIMSGGREFLDALAG